MTLILMTYVPVMIPLKHVSHPTVITNWLILDSQTGYGLYPGDILVGKAAKCRKLGKNEDTINVSVSTTHNILAMILIGGPTSHVNVMCSWWGRRPTSHVMVLSSWWGRGTTSHVIVMSSWWGRGPASHMLVMSSWRGRGPASHVLVMSS